MTESGLNRFVIVFRRLLQARPGRIHKAKKSTGILFLFLCLAALSCCASTQEPEACTHVSSDQAGSFMAKVGSFPVSIHTDSTFTAEEQGLVAQAAQDWNDFSQSIMGTPVFEISEPVEFDPSERSVDPHDCSQNYGSSQVLVLMKETDSGHWHSLGFDDQIPGATIRCSSHGVVFEQMTIVNPLLVRRPNFQGQTSDVLAKVFAHELGHSLGLDHSCNGSTTLSSLMFVSCSNLSQDEGSYRQALMYPWISWGISPDPAPTPRVSPSEAAPAPEKHETFLRDNDRLRGSCIL